MNGHHPSHKVLLYCVIFTNVYNYIQLHTYSAGMKERCRDGCRTSLLIAGDVLVLAIFHTSLPLCHPYITIHFMEMIFSTLLITNSNQPQPMTTYISYLILYYEHKALHVCVLMKLCTHMWPSITVVMATCGILVTNSNQPQAMTMYIALSLYSMSIKHCIQYM